ncbi:MAG: hypothetical protein EU529_16120, partial [Promethearchaeota archaeon]
MKKNKIVVILACLLALFLISNVSQILLIPKSNKNAEDQNITDENIQTPKLAGDIEIEITSYDAFISCGDELSVSAEIYSDYPISTALIAFFLPNGSQIGNWEVMSNFGNEYWYKWDSGTNPPGHDYFFFIWANDTDSPSSESEASETFKIISFEEDSEIFIDGTGTQNWAWAATQDWFGGGDGSQGNPYIIENINIDQRENINVDKLPLFGISIVNSTSHFIIRESEIIGFKYVGIQLTNVTNGQLINNTCKNDNTGINVEGSNDIVISENNVSRNEVEGIYVEEGDNINITLNDVTENGEVGIWGGDISNSMISENVVNEQEENGIFLGVSQYVNISENIVNDNDEQGIKIKDCSNIIITDNLIENNGESGIYLCIDESFTSNISIEWNKVYNNHENGIMIEDSNKINVTYNVVEYNGEEDGGVGILFYGSDNSSISYNNCTYNDAVDLEINQCNDVDIRGNIIITRPDGLGIFFGGSSNLTFSNNELYNSGINTQGSKTELLTHNIDTTNLVNGKKLYYYKSEVNLDESNFTNAGQVILIDCVLANVSNVDVSNTFVGIWLHYCNDSIVTQNNASNNQYGGIGLEHCYNVNITDNIADNNYMKFDDGGIGIALYISDYCRIENNNATNNLMGIRLDRSLNNILKDNRMYGCGLSVDGWATDIGTNTINTTNLVNGKKLYYYYNESYLGPSDFTNPGQIVLVSCNESSIYDYEFSQITYGITLIDCYKVNSSMINITSAFMGFYVINCTLCNIFDCKIFNSTAGIFLVGVDQNGITYNDLLDNFVGIVIYSETGEDPPENTDNIILGNYIRCDSIQNCIRGGFGDGSTGNTFTDNYCNGFLLVSPQVISNEAELTNLRDTEPWCTGDGSIGNPYTIEGIFIMHCTSGEDCIAVSNTNSHLVIKNCTLINAWAEDDDFRAGVNFYLANNVTVNNNTMIDCQRGVTAVGSANFNITGNKMYDNIYGGLLILGGCYNINISNNDIDGGEWEGIHMSGCADCIIANNKIHNIEEVGVEISGVNFTLVYENNIYDNGDAGLEIQSTTDTEGEVKYCQNNSIYSNNIYENRWCGISISTRSTNSSKTYLRYNSIYSNNITGNDEDGIIIYHDLEDEQANYWEVYIQENNIYSNNITNNDGNGIWADICTLTYDAFAYFSDNNFYLNLIEGNERNGILFIKNWKADWPNYIQNNTIAENLIFNNSMNGISLDHNRGVFVIDNTIYSNEFDGIHLQDGKNYDITDNEVFDNYGDGIYFDGYESTYNNFSYNTVYKNGGNGIISSDGSDNIISYNYIYNNTLTGIYLEAECEDEIAACNNTMISYNNITGNLNHGIFLNVLAYTSTDSYGINNTIVYNRIINNTEHGIYVNAGGIGSGSPYCENNNISYNIIDENDYGIYLNQSNYNYVSNNNLTNNNICIYENNCVGNTFINNNCTGIDSIHPTISITYYDASAEYGMGYIFIEANVTDDVLLVSPVKIEFFYPNGTQIGTPDNMTFIGGINYNYTWNVNSYEALDNYYFNITAW